MNMNEKIDNYILLSKIFGACLDMVQGKGGNISVKDEEILIIKQSGFDMSQTVADKGYVLCSIPKLTQKFQEQNESLESTVLAGNGKPSMESFFHLLPHRYIVHIHPTSFLNLLCQSDLHLLNTLFPKALCIPYVQPGFELSVMIHKLYTGQELIFLQNHGIIFLADSIDSIISLSSTTFHTLQTAYPSKRISDIQYLYSLYLRNISTYWKPSFLLQTLDRIPCVYSFTPDLHLFLKQSFDTNVQMRNGICYIGGPSKESAETLEQMFASYILTNFDTTCKEIPLECTQDLEQNPLEQARLGLSK